MHMLKEGSFWQFLPLQCEQYPKLELSPSLLFFLTWIQRPREVDKA